MHVEAPVYRDGASCGEVEVAEGDRGNSLSDIVRTAPSPYRRESICNESVVAFLDPRCHIGSKDRKSVV